MCFPYAHICPRNCKSHQTDHGDTCLANDSIFWLRLLCYLLLHSKVICSWETCWTNYLFKSIVGITTGACFSWIHWKVSHLYIIASSFWSVNFTCVTCCLLGVAILMANSVCIINTDFHARNSIQDAEIRKFFIMYYLLLNHRFIMFYPCERTTHKVTFWLQEMPNKIFNA